MKFELFLFLICGGLMYNTYHDNKYLRMIQSWKKYLNMAGIAFVGISIYLYIKKDPRGSHDMFRHASKLMSHMPVDKKSSTMAQMLLNSQVNNQQNRTPPHVNNIEKPNSKRCVSETKKKYVASSQNWTCKNCQEKLEATFEVDHVIELQDGGSNNIDNLVALCRNCHGKKGMFRKILN
jgi:hypothetical protein